VRLILPFGPASGADIGARLLAEKLQPLWGQPVVVEGKPGGDGLLSINAVLNAKDDHTFFFGPTSAYVVHPYVHDNLSYDPEKDLTPIAGVAQVQIAIAVPTKLGLNTLKDFIDYAKKNQDKVSYGVAPGFSEFVFDGFKREQGLNIPKVPYRDITTSPSDIGEGRLQLGMMSYAAMRATEELGTIKVLAMNSVKRSEIAPNTPSVVEAGFPSLVASPVLGMLGPRDMPMALRQKIARDIMEVMKDPQIRERLNLSGQPAAPMNVEEFTKAVNEQHAQVARIAKLLDIPRKK
jgi:tripartite-type tricarboxylate transporter receptor subunit TctC